MYYFNVDTWVALNTAISTPSDVEKIKSITYNNNIYFTSNGGVQKLDSVTGDLIDSGAPRGLNAVLTENSEPYGSAIPASDGATPQTVAYRILWGYRDANDNLIKGSPSQREIFSTLSTEITDVDLKIYIPSTPDESWFYQIYRSDAVTTGEPLDELFLAYEGNPLAGDITNGYVEVTDVQPESMLGESLYTNATQQGILQANDEPPKCRDMAVYQSHVFYANTETKYQQEIQLLGINPCDRLAAGITDVATQLTIEDETDFPTAFPFDIIVAGETMTVTSAAGPIFQVTRGVGIVHANGVTVTLKGRGLSEGDTITIDGTEFTAKYSDTLGTLEFAIYSESDPAYDVERTARSLVSQVNADLAANNKDVSALYISLGDTTSLPGKILLQERDYAAAGEFTTIATSVITGALSYTWTPDLSTAQTATNDRKANRIYYSKFQIPEAVPALNYFDVGAANDKILRILPLRTALLVFTEAGIYRLTGTTSNAFQVSLLDNTTKLLSPDTAVVLNNSVFGLFDQGIGSVDQQVNILSRAIEGDILELRGAIGGSISKAFGIGYESDRKYVMYLPTLAGGSPNLAYVYNTVTNTWTTYSKSANHGLVSPMDDKMYLVGNNNVSKERKDFTESDIADEQLEGHITATNAEVITVDPTLAGVASADDIFYVNGNKFSPIISVSSTANTITLQDALNFAAPTTLDGDALEGDTEIDLVAGALFAEGDIILVGTELILLGTKSTNKFTGCTRGYKGTTDADHLDTADVYAYCEIRTSFETDVEWNPIIMDHPSTLKQFSECTLLTNKPMQAFSLGFKTWTSNFYERIDFVGDTVGQWGLFEWGESPWGGEQDVVRYRTYIPKAKQRDSAIVLRIIQQTVYNNFELSGFSILYRNIGQKIKR